MTDEVSLESAALDTDMATAPVQEKMLPVSRVEELVKKAKLKGRDAMQEELEALKAENERLKGAAPVVDRPPVQSVDADAIRQKVIEDLKAEFQSQSEAQAQAQLQQEAERLANDYHTKMGMGKETYNDFDEVMADFNPAAFPNLVYLATQVDNTPAVMYELMKNPNKWATAALLSDKDPKAAQNMIARISASIKANEQAKAQEKEVAAPLSRLQSSPTGQDTGEKSIADYKQMFRG